ncbi:hypothetical protein [Halomonas sp. BC04]|uniref:hypothetical protein n=1 Tax=Halomonas sp. BC04 TaxID=1403540 RepID=UPI002F35E7E6
MKQLTTLLAGLTLAGAMTTAQAADITVGGKNFTEQQIIASMTGQYLEHLATTSTPGPAWARRCCARPRRMARSISTGSTPAPH